MYRCDVVVNVGAKQSTVLYFLAGIEWATPHRCQIFEHKICDFYSHYSTITMATYSSRLQVFRYLYCSSQYTADECLLHWHHGVIGTTALQSASGGIARSTDAFTNIRQCLSADGRGGVHVMIAQAVVVDRYPLYPNHRGDGANSSDYRRPRVCFNNHDAGLRLRSSPWRCHAKLIPHEMVH